MLAPYHSVVVGLIFPFAIQRLCVCVCVCSVPFDLRIHHACGRARFYTARIEIECGRALVVVGASNRMCTMCCIIDEHTYAHYARHHLDCNCGWGWCPPIIKFCQVKITRYEKWIIHQPNARTEYVVLDVRVCAVARACCIVITRPTGRACDYNGQRVSDISYLA